MTFLLIASMISVAGFGAIFGYLMAVRQFERAYKKAKERKDSDCLGTQVIDLGEIEDVIPKVSRRLLQHDGDCTFYASLINGRPYDGICTCGYGWYVWRKNPGDDSELLSAARQRAKMPS
jgi:hypothetical protein